MGNLDEILARLPIKGATLVGGSSSLAGFLTMLGADGLLDPSVVPGLGDLSLTAANTSFVYTYTNSGLTGLEPLSSTHYDTVQKAIQGVDTLKLTKSNNLSDVPNPITAFNNVKQAATTSYAGVVSLAIGSEVQAGTDNAKAITSSTLATYYVPLQGATMLGPLILEHAPVQANEAATKAYVDTAVANNVVSLINLGNLVYLDAVNGNDTSALRGRLDKPAITPAKALQLAQSGDTIVVLPGAYVGNNLLKTGVNWYFMFGAVLTHSGASSRAMFDDTDGTMNCKVLGYGAFASSGTNKVLFNLTSSSSSLEVEAISATTNQSTLVNISNSSSAVFRIETLSATEAAIAILGGGSNSIKSTSATYTFNSAGPTYGVSLSNGTNTIRIDSYTSNKGGISITGGTNNLFGDTYTTSNGDLFNISTGTTELLVRHCINTSTAGNKVINMATGTVRVYNAELKNTSNAAASNPLYISNSAASLTIKNCDLVPTGGIASADATSTGTLSLRGYNSAVNAVSGAITLGAGGMFETLT